MVCKSCGEKKAPKDNCSFTKAVVEINNPETLTLLRKVVVPASLGDDETYPASVGKYCNVILAYEANEHVYIYSSDGIPTLISEGTPELDEIWRAIRAEESARTEADNAIWTEIEEIEMSSDVVDIVGTYAELQQYDTSKLHDNDIIKVLQDETHQNETAYYRWSTATDTFSYVGSEGPYYTESEVDTLLDGKQDTLIAGTNIQIAADGKTISATDTTYTAGTGLDLNGTEFSVDTTAIQEKLTAGSNVQINDNVISATDTTYSNYTGATSLADGTAGLVPAPLAGDETKFLSGNGQWTTVSQYSLPIASANDLGGIKVGNNLTINSTTGVLDATDTTYSNFVGTDGQTAGTTGLVPAPATTDAGKFLKADGTWDNAGSPITVVQTTGTSTTDVMSQNATTSMVFADPSTKQQVQIGDGANASGVDAIAIGAYSSARTQSVGIGYNTESTGIHAIAIGAGGYGAKADGITSIALGSMTWATGQRSIAIGTLQRRSTPKGSIAIGSGATATSVGEMNIGSADITDYGYNNSNYRLLTGLYDPQSAHDAATKGYVDGKILTNAGAPTTSTTGTVGQLYQDTTNGDLYICTDATNPYVWEEVGSGGGSANVFTTNEWNALWA